MRKLSNPIGDASKNAHPISWALGKKFVHAERWTLLQDIICGPFKLFRFPNLVAELRNILIKSMGIRVVAKIAYGWYTST